MHPIFWVLGGLFLLTRSKTATAGAQTGIPANLAGATPAQVQAAAAAAVQKALAAQQAAAAKGSSSGGGSSGGGSGGGAPSSQQAQAVAQSLLPSVPPGIDPANWAAALDAIGGVDYQGNPISFDTTDATVSDSLASEPAPTDFSWTPPEYNPVDAITVAPVDAPADYTWTPPTYDPGGSNYPDSGPTNNYSFPEDPNYGDSADVSYDTGGDF